MLSHARLGLSPDAGTTWSLLQSLPRVLVQQMIWLAEPFSADALLTAGAINRVVDPGTAFAESMQLAERLAGMAPNALASAKELVQLGAGRTLREQLAAERDHFIENLFHSNGDEGLRAFLEKRPARFS